jgi:hypothetical protein
VSEHILSTEQLRARYEREWGYVEVMRTLRAPFAIAVALGAFALLRFGTNPYVLTFGPIALVLLIFAFERIMERTTKEACALHEQMLAAQKAATQGGSGQ